MPVPAAVYIAATVAAVGCAWVFMEFVYEPHIHPSVLRLLEEFEDDKPNRRQRRLVRAHRNASFSSDSEDDEPLILKRGQYHGSYHEGTARGSPPFKHTSYEDPFEMRELNTPGQSLRLRKNAGAAAAAALDESLQALSQYSPIRSTPAALNLGSPSTPQTPPRSTGCRTPKSHSPTPPATAGPPTARGSAYATATATPERRMQELPSISPEQRAPSINVSPERRMQELPPLPAPVFATAQEMRREVEDVNARNDATTWGLESLLVPTQSFPHETPVQAQPMLQRINTDTSAHASEGTTPLTARPLPIVETSRDRSESIASTLSAASTSSYISNHSSSSAVTASSGHAHSRSSSFGQSHQHGSFHLQSLSQIYGEQAVDLDVLSVSSAPTSRSASPFSVVAGSRRGSIVRSPHVPSDSEGETEGSEFDFDIVSSGAEDMDVLSGDESEVGGAGARVERANMYVNGFYDSTRVVSREGSGGEAGLRPASPALSTASTMFSDMDMMDDSDVGEGAGR